MPFSVKCPNCGKVLKAPDELAGKKVRCANCHQVLMVPDRVLDAEVVDDEPAPAAAAAPEPEPEAYGVSGLTGEGRPKDADRGEGAVGAAPDRRPCPMCGEMILRKAAKCRHCGEIFDPDLREREEKRRRRSSGPGDDDLTAAEWVVAILCSGIGCICGIVWLIQGKEKGKKMLAVSLIASVVWGTIRVLIETAARNAR